MPERSFGRTVRYRRTKIGLSQAQLGELVGRSASSVRSWERDVSIPTDPSVLNALSAILDIDGRVLYDKAGVSPLVATDDQPTVEEALASLAPLPLEEPIEEEVGPDPLITGVAAASAADPGLDMDSELEAEVHEHTTPAYAPEPVAPGEPETPIETFTLPTEPRSDRLGEPETVAAAKMTSANEPAFVSPPEPYLITTPTAPVVEASYIEDNDQRQLYRVRSLATVVLVVALAIILLWALGNTIDAIGAWWEDFFNTLRI
jgi:transcriptional regulator with XRE-family HTH domain